MASDTEITKVRIVIRHLLWQIREVRKDRDAAWKWVNRFANTLQYQDLEQDPDQYALAILAEARSFNDQKKRNQQMRWVREQLAKEGVKKPTQEQLDEKWLEMYGNETTADGDTREDSQDLTDGSNSGIMESGTSATHSATTPCTISADDKGRRTGADSLRSDCHSAPVRSLPMPSKEQLYDFARLENLDEADARDWYEMTVVDRDGKDRNGNRITNWKAACRKFCEGRANRRSA